MSVLIDAVEPVHGLSHEGGVWHRETHIRSSLVVQDSGLLLSWHLDTLVSRLVTTREGHLVAVHNYIFVTLKEILLEALCVNHGWTQVDVTRVKTPADVIVVPRANLHVNAFEVTPSATVQWLV